MRSEEECGSSTMHSTLEPEAFNIDVLPYYLLFAAILLYFFSSSDHSVNYRVWDSYSRKKKRNHLTGLKGRKRERAGCVWTVGTLLCGSVDPRYTMYQLIPRSPSLLSS